MSKKPLIGITCGREAAKGWDPAEPARAKNFLFHDYVVAVEHSGGIPLILPPLEARDTFVEALSRMNGLLLTGGGDVSPGLYGEQRTPEATGLDRRRDDCETAVLREARKRRLAVLGICRGIQIMAVAFGGTLYGDLPSEKEGFDEHWQSAPRGTPSHRVRINRASRLFQILKKESLWVNSRHHQAVKAFPAGFVVSASAEDGLVEALEDPAHPFFLAVQWHPEGTFHGDTDSRKIFDAFIQAAQKARPS